LHAANSSFGFGGLGFFGAGGCSALGEGTNQQDIGVLFPEFLVKTEELSKGLIKQ
jgi:hypothetical protein